MNIHQLSLPNTRVTACRLARSSEALSASQPSAIYHFRITRSYAIFMQQYLNIEKLSSLPPRYLSYEYSNSWQLVGSVVILYTPLWASPTPLGLSFFPPPPLFLPLWLPLVAFSLLFPFFCVCVSTTFFWVSFSCGLFNLFFSFSPLLLPIFPLFSSYAFLL